MNLVHLDNEFSKILVYNPNFGFLKLKNKGNLFFGCKRGIYIRDANDNLHYIGILVFCQHKRFGNFNQQLFYRAFTDCFIAVWRGQWKLKVI